jgi:hypothetical protein
MPIHSCRAPILKAPADRPQLGIVGFARGASGVGSRIVAVSAATSLIFCFPEFGKRRGVVPRARLRVRGRAS